MATIDINYYEDIPPELIGYLPTFEQWAAANKRKGYTTAEALQGGYAEYSRYVQNVWSSLQSTDDTEGFTFFNARMRSRATADPSQLLTALRRAS